MSGCMSAFGGMPPVEFCEGLKQLKNEHPPLLKQLEGLYNLTQKVKLEEDFENSFSQLVKDVKSFKEALEPHSEREEGVLFPMMGSYIGTTSGPIAVMEYEHDQAKLNIRNFLESAEAGVSVQEGKILAEFIEKAYFILTAHFAKEENVLFPMAEKMLTSDEKLEFYNKIQEIK